MTMKTKLSHTKRSFYELFKNYLPDDGFGRSPGDLLHFV